ncbi:hypothetical protein L7F22_058583 [Adiantum nelumboides]|nr:hypothetical protein [Adiantum nelumboides]
MEVHSFPSVQATLPISSGSPPPPPTSSLNSQAIWFSSPSPPPCPPLFSASSDSTRNGEDDHSALDPEIWGMVPPELLERIISKLPITSVLRFRAVCRRWNQLPFDKQFPKLPPHQMGACPPFLSRHFGIFYIDGSGKWRTIPFHFFPLKHVILEASGGGLLLFSKSSFASRLVEAFYVCNPITKQWHELKGFSIRSVCVSCIDVNPLTLDFKVVIAGWDDLADRFSGGSPFIEVYNSRNQSWSKKHNIFDDDFSKLRGVAFVRGTLYLAVHSRNFSNLKVLALHLENQFTELCGTFGERSKFHCFGQYRGKLTAVVQRRGVEVMEIWQLKKQDSGKLLWVLLDKLAEEKLNAFSSAAVAGGFVFFNYYDEPIAVYDLHDQSWQWVDFPPGRKYSLGMRPIAFQPSFVPLKVIQ